MVYVRVRYPTKRGMGERDGREGWRLDVREGRKNGMEEWYGRMVWKNAMDEGDGMDGMGWME